MGRLSEVFAISVPPKMARTVERVARQENRTKSELFRIAFMNYMQERNRWQAIRSFGGKTAQALKINSGRDVEKLIDSIRK